jgi:hypothetical protein
MSSSADHISTLIAELQKILKEQGDLPVELSSSFVTPDQADWATDGIPGETWVWCPGVEVGLTLQQGKVIVHDPRVG